MLAHPNRTPRISEMGHAMLMAEFEEGREPIWPQNAPDWVVAADWHGWPVLSIADGELHIVAIWSARKGALTRLIAGARTAGLSPVIVAPIGVMPAILAKWGWQQRITGSGWDTREEWRPRDSDTHRMAETRSGSGRSPSSAGLEEASPTPPTHNHQE
jgi:hypothetical protein